MANGFVWLTNIETSEPVGFPLSRLLMVEQKCARDGGAVAIVLDHGKELQVSESLARVNEAIAEVKRSHAIASASREAAIRTRLSSAERRDAAT